MALNPVVSRDYNPPTFFWIALYRDGSAVPQFHPETGEEIRWGSVDQERLRGAGWFPFTRKFSLLILEKTGLVTRPSNYRSFIKELKPGQTLIIKREQQIITYGFHRCLECKNFWQFMEGKPNPHLKLVRSNKAFVEEFEVSTEAGLKLIKVRSPICPACGYHDSNAV